MPEQALALTIQGVTPELSLFLHGKNDTIISERLRTNGIWEAYETELTVKLLKAGDVYIDAGANIGYYSLIASRKVGSTGKVLSFEPDTQNFSLLEKNIAFNQADNIQAFRLALSDKNDAGKLFLSEDNLGDHRIYDDAGRASYAIKLVNGSEFLNTIAQVDFIKIDTQGAEYFVFNGLLPLIKKNQHRLCMIVEICPFGIRHSGAHGLQLLALMDALDMQYHYIDHIHHRLSVMSSADLKAWIESLDKDLDNEGFINLLLTPKGFDVSGL